MISIINSSSLMGIDAVDIIVEVDASPGIPGEQIVGLPDTVVRESKSRIKSAIKNSGFSYPVKFYTINLAPAGLPKEGPFFDLPIAVGLLESTDQLKTKEHDLFVGELSLTGAIKGIRGMICIGNMAKKKGYKRLFFPKDNEDESHFITDLELIPLSHLNEIREKINQKGTIYTNLSPSLFKESSLQHELLLSQVKGQFMAKRALKIAAAGKHNILLVGPPGSGKTMLLKRLPSLLPVMEIEEALTTFKLQSISKKQGIASCFSFQRPFRAPHHSISYAGMVGGGSHPMPGEISLAHNGVLFLDELPEFPRKIIELLRQPLEEKRVMISRVNFSIEYPANVLLACSMNPCPCGYFGDQKQRCHCHISQIKNYWKKISGPILDRLDLIIQVPRLRAEDFTGERQSDTVLADKDKQDAQAICQARGVQYERYSQPLCNGDVDMHVLEKKETLTPEIYKFLGSAVEKGQLTGRSKDKVIKVARTIADLDQQDTIRFQDILEAFQYRMIPKIQDVF